MEAWKKKRSRTIKTYLFFELVAGIDYVLIPITIIPYLKQLVSKEEVNFFYSLESIVGYIISAITGLVISRIVDRTRNVKYSLYFVLSCTIIGQILYTIRESPYFIVMARALCGTLPAQGYVHTGEILRCFKEEEASKVLWWYSTATTIGYIIGSWISLTFYSINFSIGGWKVDTNNFAGIFLLVLCAACLLCVYLFTYNCSKEYDIKALTERTLSCTSPDNFENSIGLSDTTIEDEENIDVSSNQQTLISDKISDKETIDEESIETFEENEVFIENPVYDSVLTILYKFICRIDIVFIMISSFLYGAVGFTTDLMTPIVILEILKWEPKYLSIQQGASSIVMAISSLLLSKYAVSSLRIYTASIVAILMSFASIVLLILITSVTTTAHWQIALVALYTGAITPIWYLDTPLFANMLGKMVKTEVQSFAESCRSLLSLSSCILVGIFIVKEGFLMYLLYGLSAFMILSFYIFLYRYKSFVNIKLMIV